jgi:hypothetical protein
MTRWQISHVQYTDYLLRSQSSILFQGIPWSKLEKDSPQKGSLIDGKGFLNDHVEISNDDAYKQSNDVMMKHFFMI